MAQDCYKLFKTVFAQAKTDGLVDAAASEAAGRAMSNCLGLQALQTPAVQPIISVPGGLARDPGPTSGSQDINDRSDALGQRDK